MSVFYFFLDMDINCPYIKEQQRLMRLFEEVDSVDEESDDEEDDEENEDCLETREASDTEQEGESETEEESTAQSVPGFTAKDGTSWNKHPFSQRVRKSRANIVTHLPGVKGVAKNAKTPLDCWNLFFSEEMLVSIVKNINTYIEAISEKYQRSRDAKPTNLPEIKALFGLLYLAGIHKSNRLNTEELWNRDGTGVDLFWLTMSIQRFRFLLRVIRTDDKNTRDQRRETDKLAPIRKIFDSFVQNCQKHYTISEYATIDEKLEAFRGRSNLKQYIPSKPNKYGIKIFALVDAKMYYSYNLEVCVGRQPEGRFQKSNDPKSVVLRMIEPITKTGRNITVDNWFTSYELMNELLQNHKLTLVGTLRKNKRELPPGFVNTKHRPVNSSMFAFQKDKTLVSYVPRKGKNVILLSSMHFDDEIDPDTGDSFKPSIITFYNKTKGGVDIVDGLSANYNCARNTKRWPMVVLYSLLNIAGINSHIIFTSNNPNVDLKRRRYLMKLVRELISEYQKYRATLTNLPRQVRYRRQEAAGMSQEQRQRPEAGKRKRCEECVKKDSKTSYYSKKCYKYLCLSHANIYCKVCEEGNIDIDDQSI